MSAADKDTDYVAEALPAFVNEAREQIERFEQLMLALEETPDDHELLDALFRCAHTVKGSAGMFGLDRVVAFTHHVETLLDKMREGEVGMTGPIGTLLLRCNDQIRALVESAPGGDADPAGDALRDTLVAELKVAAGTSAAAEAPPRDAPSAAPAASTGERRWRVAVRFGADVFRNGMDPLAILNYLRGMGTIVDLACDVGAVPSLESLDAETCHLAFKFGFETAASREEIESAFSFVREDCELAITEPAVTAIDARAAIEALPDQPRIGDILLGAGAITRAQLGQGLQAQANAAASGPVPPLGAVLQESAGVPSQVLNAALEKQQKQRAGGAADETRYIRVQADRLDAVINLLGELVIAGAGATLLARQAKERKLVEQNLQVGRLIEEIRNGTLQLRMVPIGETFARFRRTVRDVAAELGKDVALEIDGGETELDKSVVERIADPLMHLVRNALDHGLETPAARLEAGKPAQGRLVLSACHESGSIVIRITDDGRGIVRSKVLARAWERGIVEQGVRPADEDILKLIFAPGFSTAEKVTNLSGRGVGMDVVKRNIEALRGSVEVTSEEGRGSTIEIRLPLTLAIIDGFLVAAGTSKFIFPLETVVEVVERRRAQNAPDARGRTVIELRGQPLPVLDLRVFYGLEGAEPERASVVVLQAGHRRYGVIVDTLLGQHQTVIKPLGRMFRSLRGMSGSSILGNGEVALIFDVNALSELAAAVPARGSNNNTHGEPA